MHARFYAPNLILGAPSVELPTEEAEHLSRVLRLSAGDSVRVFDGLGHECEGRVELVARGRAVVALGSEVAAAGGEPPLEIVLGQALLKGDAIDQVVRDAVMLGVSRIVPLETERSEMPARRVRAAGRVQRWQRIAVASVKQCGRAVVPEVTEPASLSELLAVGPSDLRFILAEPSLASGAVPATLAARGAAAHRVLLLVGPEGGWTVDELLAAKAAGCQRLTLGPRTLRADAAALVGLTALQCMFGDFSPAISGI